MEQPEEPNLQDCCNSGCNPCIFDVYERQMKLYKRDNGKIREEKESNGISDIKYTSFEIVDSILIWKTLKLLKFKTTEINNLRIWWKPGDHFLMKYNDGNSVSCTRAYTPVKLNVDKNKDFDFSIIVKRYKNGLVSNYLFNLEVGAVTLWRGPYGSYEYKANTFNRIVMIAQGTGIAPFISIIESILNNDDDMTKIMLLYGCQSIEEVLFRNQLNLYRSYWNFMYEIFLSDESVTMLKYQEPVTKRRLSTTDLHNLRPFVNNQFLICGSKSFMQCYGDFLKMEGLENIILF